METDIARDVVAQDRRCTRRAAGRPGVSALIPRFEWCTRERPPLPRHLCEYWVNDKKHADLRGSLCDALSHVASEIFQSRELFPVKGLLPTVRYPRTVILFVCLVSRVTLPRPEHGFRESPVNDSFKQRHVSFGASVARR